jgi:hypothetical protein
MIRRRNNYFKSKKCRKLPLEIGDLRGSIPDDVGIVKVAWLVLVTVSILVKGEVR